MQHSKPRRRERDERIGTNTHFHTENSLSGTLSVSDSDLAGTPGGAFRRMDDVVTPNYVSIKATGGIVNNRMSSVEETYNFTPVSMLTSLTHPIANAGKHTILATGHYGSLLESLLYDPLGMKFHAIGGENDSQVIFASAARARSQVNPDLVQGIVTLAELPKTINMITKAARTFARLGKTIANGGNLDQITDLVLGVKKGTRSRASDAVTGVSSRYLEYRYGWRILLLEMQSVIKAMDQLKVVRPRAVARGAASESRSVVSQANYDPPNEGTETYTFNSHYNVKVRSYVLYEADFTYQSARLFGVGEIPLAAWELIPFSFVVDWFIPIGNWIEAITPKLGIKVLAEGYTIERRQDVTRQLTTYTPESSGTTRYERSGHLGFVDSWSYVRKDRVPTLSDALLYPRVDVKLNVARCLDAIALLATVGQGVASSLRR